MLGIAALVFALASPVVSHGQSIVYQNPLNAQALEGGPFSTPQQPLATTVSLTRSANVDAAWWFGVARAGMPGGIGATWTFDLVVRASIDGTPGETLTTRSVVADVTSTDVFLAGERVYRFDAVFDAVAMSAGPLYYMSVLSTRENDTFRWTQGTEPGDAYWLDSGLWVQLDPTRRPLNLTLVETSQAVPEPATLTLLLLAGGVLWGTGGRRRLRRVS